MILVDSDVPIAHLRGLEAAREWLSATRRSDGRLSTGVVTYAEVAGSMRSGERRAVARLFAAFDLVEITKPIGARAGELQRAYRRSHSGIGIADYLIAATAQVRGIEVATLNVRHFPMFEDLRAPFPIPG